MGIDGRGIFAVVDDGIEPEDVARAVVRGHGMPVAGKRVVLDEDALRRTEPQRGPGAAAVHDNTVARGSAYGIEVVHVRERVQVEDASGEILDSHIMDPEVHRVRKTEAHVLLHVRVGIEGAIEREIPHLEAGDSRDLEHDQRTTHLATERRQAYALTFQYDRLGDDDGRTPGRKRAGG